MTTPTTTATASKAAPGFLHALARRIPLIGVLRTYPRGWLRGDAAAGATVFAVLVPSALAYGELAGLEPVAGLYAAIWSMPSRFGSIITISTLGERPASSSCTSATDGSTNAIYQAGADAFIGQPEHLQH